MAVAGPGDKVIVSRTLHKSVLVGLVYAGVVPIWVRPEINPETGSVDFLAAADDIAWLCQNFALSRVTDEGPIPSQIIISLEDRPVPFGEAAPDATQFFEAFALQDGTCIWEMF